MASRPLAALGAGSGGEAISYTVRETASAGFGFAQPASR